MSDKKKPICSIGSFITVIFEDILCSKADVCFYSIVRVRASGFLRTKLKKSTYSCSMRDPQRDLNVDTMRTQSQDEIYSTTYLYFYFICLFVSCMYVCMFVCTSMI